MSLRRPRVPKAFPKREGLSSNVHASSQLNKSLFITCWSALLRPIQLPWCVLAVQLNCKCWREILPKSSCAVEGRPREIYSFWHFHHRRDNKLTLYLILFINLIAALWARNRWLGRGDLSKPMKISCDTAHLSSPGLSDHHRLTNGYKSWVRMCQKGQPKIKKQLIIIINCRNLKFHPPESLKFTIEGVRVWFCILNDLCIKQQLIDRAKRRNNSSRTAQLARPIIHYRR